MSKRRLDDDAVERLATAIAQQACKDYLKRYPPSSVDALTHKTPREANRELKIIEHFFEDSWLMDLAPKLNYRPILEYLKRERMRKYGQLYYSKETGRCKDARYTT